MKENNYIPQEKSQLLDWLENFSNLLPSIGGSLGVTPAEIASLNALIASVKNDLVGGNNDDEDKKNKRDKALVFVVSIVVKMKGNIEYDKDTHGLKMRIE